MRIGRFPLRNNPFPIHKLIHGRYSRYSTVKGDLGIKIFFPLKTSFKNLQQLQPIPVMCRSLLQISRLPQLLSLRVLILLYKTLCKVITRGARTSDRVQVELILESNKTCASMASYSFISQARPTKLIYYLKYSTIARELIFTINF